MKDVTQIINRIEQGDPQATEKLLPLVYDELRRLTASRMNNERIEHTLTPTALVHEAYMRLVDPIQEKNWNGLGHFFGAAAEAMRRILIDHARKKHAAKRGGEAQKFDLVESWLAGTADTAELLELDEALDHLESADAKAKAKAKAGSIFRCFVFSSRIFEMEACRSEISGSSDSISVASSSSFSSTGPCWFSCRTSCRRGGIENCGC